MKSINRRDIAEFLGIAGIVGSLIFVGGIIAKGQNILYLYQPSSLGPALISLELDLQQILRLFLQLLGRPGNNF